MHYIIKIQDAANPDAPLLYLRQFESDDLSRPIAIIDKALNVKPRKPRSDAGKARNQEVKP